jgi:hypothetical protein
MSERMALGRAAESSVVVRALARGAAWCRETNGRVAAGVRSRTDRPAATPEQLRMVADDSVVVRTLTRLIDLPVKAWQHATAKRLFDSVLSLDLAVRMSLLGWMLLAAIVTHVVVVAALGVPVSVLGWSTRAVLALLAVALIVRPAVFAAAWRDRHER